MRLVRRALAVSAICGLSPNIVSQAVAESADQTGVAIAQAQQIDNPLRNASDPLEEIRVTASRREQSLREVPTAVSAYSGDQLQHAQITSLSDLASASPNMQFSSFANYANIDIRGIGNTGGAGAAGTDSGVALSVDGVYLGESGLAASTFLDIARVEILRGPQGTLFGRNATGGAVNVIPNYPTRDFEFGFDASFGVDPALVRSSAYASGPLTGGGELLGRVSVGQSYNDGYERNLVSTGPKRLDGVDNNTERVQVEWLPSDTFTARLLLEIEKETDNGPAVYLVGTPDPNQPPPIAIRGAATGNINARTAYANLGDQDIDARAADLTTDWLVGRGDLKAILSYRTSDEITGLDGDGTSAPFTSTLFHNVAHQDYSELLYASDAGKAFNYIIGTNFYHEDLHQDLSVPIEGFPLPVEFNGPLVTTSYAGFVHGQYEVLPKAKIFAGVRYSHDKKSIDEFNDFIGSKSQEKAWSRVTYESGLSYSFSPFVSSYLKYATGYKGGGYSLGALAPAVNPETDKEIEAGVKGSYLDGRLQANVAAFHISYDDLQVQQIIGVSSTLTNAAQATIDGIETELTAHPTDYLRLELGASWLNARFDQFVTSDSARPVLGILNLAGNQLPLAPHITSSVGAYCDLPLPSSGQITPGVRFDWKSRLYFDQFNTPVASQSAAGKFDLFMRYTSDNRRWSASVFALNVTDEHIKSNVLVVSALLGSLALAQYQPSRQVGASVGYRF